MGVFGKLRNFASSAVDGVKKIASCALDGVKKVGSAVVNTASKGITFAGEKINKFREAVSDTWAGFTGKKKVDEAKKLYEEIERRYNEEKNSYEAFKEKYSKSIKAHIDNINFYKEMIKSELLPQFMQAISKLYQYPIPDGFNMEDYTDKEIKIEDLKAKEDLLTIDWDKHPWLNTIKAVFTLGFWTKKQAEESLKNVEAQKLKVNENIAKMNAEKKRIERIDQALENAEYYFQKVIELYEVMLVRVNNSIDTLYVSCMVRLHKFVHKEMSFRRLTKVQIKELEAAFVATEIIKDMINKQVLSNEDVAVDKYSSEIKEQYESVEKGYQAA